MTPYIKGARKNLPQKKRRQLRNIDRFTHNELVLKRTQKDPNGELTNWLLAQLNALSAFFIHLPFGLFLKTEGGLMETLVPLNGKTRRAVDDWLSERIGTKYFHMGSLFGLVSVLVRLNSQRIVFYIPPKLYSLADIKAAGPQFADFTVITIERSIPNWTGHVASMVQILSVAIVLATNTAQSPPIATSLFFQQMAEKIIEPDGPDIYAMAELLNVPPETYAKNMLDAIDHFIQI